MSVRNDSFIQSRDSGSAQKWTDSACILKPEPAGWVNRFDRGNEKMLWGFRPEPMVRTGLSCTVREDGRGCYQNLCFVQIVTCAHALSKWKWRGRERTVYDLEVRGEIQSGDVNMQFLKYSWAVRLNQGVSADRKQKICKDWAPDRTPTVTPMVGDRAISTQWGRRKTR